MSAPRVPNLYMKTSLVVFLSLRVCWAVQRVSIVFCDKEESLEECLLVFFLIVNLTRCCLLGRYEILGLHSDSQAPELAKAEKALSEASAETSLDEKTA